MSMENTFKFIVGMGRYIAEADVEVEIPMELYERVVAEVGTDKMARLEFGFHFQEICEEKYPELDTIIHKTIEQWIQTYNLGDTPAYWMHFYRLQSPWFE